jgi:tetratricopeptide (TPR) repeat protein
MAALATLARCCVLALCVAAAATAAGAQPRELAAKSERGKEAMAAGKFDQAVAIYSELARALPNDAGILMNLGIAQSMGGHPREAVRSLERAVKLQPSLHPAWLFLGTAYLDAGDAASAVRPLSKAVATDPTSLKARRMLADAYLTLERFDAAGRELRKLTELDQNDPATWYALGQTHEARARLAFDELRQLAPGSPYESFITADVLASEEKYDEAVEHYRMAIAKLPRLRADALERIAEIYEQAGRRAQAAEERRTLESLPAPDCVRDKTACAFHAGRYVEAIAALRARRDAEASYWRVRAHNELALEAFSRLDQLPASPQSHEFRARLYRSQGRHIDSIDELQRARTLAPEDRRIQRELATSFYLSRDYESAERLLEALIREEPSAELQFLYGDTLLQAQKPEKAIPLLEAAVRADPAVVTARASLARAYLQVGRQADAIPHLKAALAIDEDGSLHYQLARAYQATGQAELAKQMMAKYAVLQKEKRR